MSLIAVRRHKLLDPFVQLLIEEVKFVNNAEVFDALNYYLKQALESVNLTNFQPALLKTRQIVEVILVQIEKTFNLKITEASYAERLDKIQEVSPLNTFYRGPQLPYNYEQHLTVVSVLDSLRKIGNLAAHSMQNIDLDRDQLAFFDVLCKVKLLITAFASANPDTGKSKKNEQVPQRQKSEQKLKQSSDSKVVVDKSLDKSQSSNKAQGKQQKPQIANKNDTPCCRNKHIKIQVSKMYWLKNQVGIAQVVWEGPNKMKKTLEHLQVQVNGNILAKSKEKLIKIEASQVADSKVSIRWQCQCKAWSEWSAEKVLKPRRVRKEKVKVNQASADGGENSHESNLSDESEDEAPALEQQETVEEDDDDDQLDEVDQISESLNASFPNTIPGKVDSQPLYSNADQKLLQVDKVLTPEIQKVDEIVVEQVAPVLSKTVSPIESYAVFSKVKGLVLKVNEGNVCLGNPDIDHLNWLWQSQQGYLVNCAYPNLVLDICNYSTLQALYKSSFDLIMYQKKSQDCLNQKWHTIRTGDYVQIESDVGGLFLSASATSVTVRTLENSDGQLWQIKKQ